MELAVRGHNISLSEPIESLVRRRLEFALDRFGSQIRRVDVKLADINGPRGGVDKECRVDVTLNRGGQVRAKSTDLHVRDAINRAVHRVGRQLTRRVGKVADHQPRQESEAHAL